MQEKTYKLIVSLPGQPNSENPWVWKLTKIQEEIDKFLYQMTKHAEKLPVLAKKYLNKSMSQAQAESKEIIFDIKYMSIENGINFTEEKMNEFLAKIIDIEAMTNNEQFYEFIEVSANTFKTDKKKKEGYVYKRSGGRHGNNDKCMYLCKYCRRLQKRWLIVTHDFVGYLSKRSDEHFHEVLMFRDKFQIIHGEEKTGYPDAVIIKTAKRKFQFHAGSVLKKNEWVSEIERALKGSVWFNIHKEKNNYCSSFPQTSGNFAKAYVDGEMYFSDLHDSLLQAKEHIMITGWWFCPQMYLKRPSTKYPNSQIIKVLEEVANNNNNLRIYVHMYREPKLALANDSEYMEKILKEALKGQVIVVRHPAVGFMGGTLNWAHHEKIIVIDDKIAFLGGLDSCYGRWDNHEHRLGDPGPDHIWNGVDYNNPRINDALNWQDYENDDPLLKEMEVRTKPRMPWHDIGICVEGNIARDVSMHFIELWNHVMTDVIVDYRKDKKLLSGKGENRESAIALTSENSRFHEDKTEEQNMEEIDKIFSKPLNNAEKKEEETIEESKEEETNEEEKQEEKNNETTPSRIPFSIDKLFGRDKSRDSNRSLQDQNSESRSSNTQPKLINSVFLPQYKKGIPTELANSNALSLQEQMKQNLKKMGSNELTNINIFTGIGMMMKNKIKKSTSSDLERDDSLEYSPEDSNFNIVKKFNFRRTIQPILQKMENSGTCVCHLVRSASTWSYGLRKPEASIHQAYLYLIEHSKHFIYIENQFFISSTAGSPVCNTVAQALVNRIIKAHEDSENNPDQQGKFIVIVMMPLLPAFKGEPYEGDSNVLKLQLHWEYQTICRSEKSIFAQLRAKGIDPHKYISFHGLRTHESFGNLGPVTEMVYIHSKLMIVDDDACIIGSANINDRSLCGRHDSEIAVVVRDNEQIESFMDNKPHSCSKFAAELRRRIFNEFLGNDKHEKKISVIDPISDEFISKWKSISSKNTVLYRKLFDCYPDDKLTNMKSLIDNVKTMTDSTVKAYKAQRYEKKKYQIRGFLVDFPLHFLEDENLTPPRFAKERLVNQKAFV